MRHRLADLAGADDQHLPAVQAARRAVVPLRTDLAGQPAEQLPLMGEQIGEQVFAHHLAEDAHRAGQGVVLRQVVGEQRRDAGPGRLHPDREYALAQHGGDQVRLAEPYRALGGGILQGVGIVAGNHVEAGFGGHDQRGVEFVFAIENEQAHGVTPCRPGVVAVPSGAS
ncbi:hypothetical protein D3C76_1023180 [compost metagenome]